ncbi:beta-ribofuranosylaminobenzene 5'-phosphate synthase family protein [Methylobrevis albus]|uniref:GHMP kinase n=1 Tax=Methylobrevis albus TaxID=2793297 RepID=A0A931MZN9_9HYPH|nr:beta-ribofuranosylaminobenzene 5'-phosphate synthase family protein [Methylobrevis albus]MBH0239632.1 GHMP kinase [Methylobrevis albus]
MNQLKVGATPESTTGLLAGVRVEAPARLHLGLLDLAGDLGRRFGSIGVAIDEPVLDLTVRLSHGFSVEGAEAARVARYAESAARVLGLDRRIAENVAITVERAIPAHAGFGSGTQLALAVAAALARIAGARFDAAKVAADLDRGARSGVGLTAFERGGFVVDGGRGPSSLVPPVLARIAFPRGWRIVLVMDPGLVGSHGTDEMEAFKSLPPLPPERAAHLCRLTMMKLLPGLVEEDIGEFGAAITEIQEVLGDHFAPAQGGRRFVSPAVTEVLGLCRAAGAAGVGQSSWGPTGFAIVPSAKAARALVDYVVMNCHTGSDLQFLITQGRNRGALITPLA